MPEDYEGKTFGELYTYFSIQRNLIALGLYRLPGSTDNAAPYVFTNPPTKTKLVHEDRVFVLASNMPKDLCNCFLNSL